MFSGIVEEVGRIETLEQKEGVLAISIAAERCLEGTQIGDSIAVNGVCLTVVEQSSAQLAFQAVPETLEKTTLQFAKVGDSVNLERALTPASRIGGHMVQGHVDTTAQVLAVETQHSAYKVIFSLPESLVNLVVPKGFITLDGMSLTVVDKTPTQFSVALIPHTLQVTIAQYYRPGTLVNLEADILGKYILNYLSVIPCPTSLPK